MTYTETHIPIRYLRSSRGCWLPQELGKTADGYHYITIDGRKIRAHIYSYLSYKGSYPHRYFLRHTCDNPRCINPDHLLPGTPQENVADRVARGRCARGERNGQSVLKSSQVRSIFLSTKPQRYLAVRFNVSKKVIYKIKKGINWGHITNKLK